MNIEQSTYLKDLYNAGHLVIITDGPYVDSPVQSIEENDDGELVYFSEVYSERKLSEISANNVQVFEPSKYWKPNVESMDSDILGDYLDDCGAVHQGNPITDADL